MKETEIAQPVIGYLEGLGWDVYQEVKQSSHGRIADIVATRGVVTWVIECKALASLSVLEQAQHWLGFANWSSVSVPAPRRWSRRRWMFGAVAESYGIGVLTVTDHGVCEAVAPRTQKKLIRNIRDVLVQEHKHFASAGTNGGGRYSPWQATMRRCSRFVRENPGCTIASVVAGVSHHYACDKAAKGNIRAWAQEGQIPGVRWEKEDGKIVLYPKTERSFVEPSP